MPPLVRRVRLEPPIQDVGRNEVLEPDARIQRRPAALGPSAQLPLTHQPRHPVLTTALAPVAQIIVDARTAVGAITPLEARSDLPDLSCLTTFDKITEAH